MIVSYEVGPTFDHFRPPKPDTTLQDFGCQTSDPRGRSFAPRGKTPVRTVRSQRKTVRVLSAVTNAGTLRFMVLKKAIDAPTLIRCLRGLIRDADRNVFLILDTLNVHKATRVRTWVADHADEIALFYLPPDAPDPSRARW